MTFDRLAFWRNPDASNEPANIKAVCRPGWYLDLHSITTLVVATLSAYLDKGDSIMELGAGTGRNLAGLRVAGYTRLAGIEINPDAIILGRSQFQALDGITITCDTVESAIKTMAHYDCIFTQGLLQHLSPDVDWIHDVIAEKADKLIMVIENEWPVGVRSWARNYKDIFEGLGWRQVGIHSNTGCYGHAPTTIMRIFQR